MISNLYELLQFIFLFSEFCFALYFILIVSANILVFEHYEPTLAFVMFSFGSFIIFLFYPL